MKKLLLAFCLAPLLLIAQTEKINFTKKLVYMDTSGRDIKNMNLYYSPQGSVIELSGTMVKYILKSDIIVPIFLDLDRSITFADDYYRMDSIPTFSFKKLSEKDTFGNYTCTYYQVSKDNRYDEDMKICIKEDPNLDIISAFNNNTKDQVKGYPVLASLDYNKKFILKDVQNTSQSISVNFKDQLEKMVEAKKRYDEQEYGDDHYTVEADTVSTEEVSPYDEYSESYTSEYKKANEIDNLGGLGIDELSGNSSYWKQIPQYCKKIDGIIPEFKNTDLKEHAKNYAGQLCDMYLSSTGYSSIAEKETLDIIRYEESYFRNTSLDKKDRKLLDNFLNDLD